MRKVFYKNLTSEITEIRLTENGFSIKEPFGAIPKSFLWKEIKNIRFSKNHREIIIKKSNTQFILKNNNIGWYQLIQNVPSKFKDFDFDYVKTFFKALKPCKICGIIAVSDNRCVVCDNPDWSKEMTESEFKYIKSKQSELYHDHITEGLEIKKIAEPEHGFEADKNWKLLI